MTPAFMVLVATAAAGAALIISLVVLVIASRRPTSRHVSLPIHFDGRLDTRYQTPCVGPIERLSFTESLDPERFSDAAEAVTLEAVSAYWKSVFDIGTVTVNGMRLLRSSAELIVTASNNGKTLIASGLATVPRHSASGSLLPQLTDARTGKIIELMKGAPSAKRLTQLAQLSSIVVGAAHIIASADIAKKLKIIDGKLDTLLAYRRIDQAAVLERIYTSAKELGCGAMDEARRLELWRLRGELRQLRSTWRRELQFHLSHIEDPANAGWLVRQFTSVVSIVGVDRQGETDRDVHGKITEGQLQLSLIEYAMRLDQVLAAGSDTCREFERTLADELVEIRTVADLLEAKAGYISGKCQGFSAVPMLTGMRAMIEHYEAILPERIAAADLPQFEPESAALLTGPSDTTRAVRVGGEQLFTGDT